MAEEKKTKKKDDAPVTDTPEINWPAAVDELTKQKAALEDYVASILVDLHLARTTFNGMGKPAGERFNRHFIVGRDLIGEKGLEIDKNLRNY